MAIIGILTGAVAFVISICMEKLVDLKYSQFDKGFSLPCHSFRVQLFCVQVHVHTWMLADSIH